jgi:signal transduction histidine kinase
LTLDVGENPIVLDADPVRLRQVIANLVENAAKYTPTNGCISVALSADGDEVAIVVRDNGRGIPQEFTQRIFEPFAQLAGDGSAGGLGLGLALVKSITELHRGSVTVLSGGPDAGSCFTVRLPRRA